MARSLLPWEWWKLSFHWLFDVGGRRPPARQNALFKNSLKAALAGLSLGVLALSLTLAVVSGFQDTLGASAARALGHLMWWSDWQKDAVFERVLNPPPAHLKEASSFWFTQGLVVGPKGGRGVRIEGRRQLYPKLNPDQTAWPEAQMDLGRPLAQYLGVKEGDTLRVLLPGLVEGAYFFKVRQLVEFGIYELDSRLALIDEDSFRSQLEKKARKILEQRPGDALGLRLYFDEKYFDPLRPERLDVAKKSFATKIQAEFPQERASVDLRTWHDQRRNLFGAIGMDKLVLTLVLSLLTLVASLNIAAILVILFLDRDREIATLQALGLSRAQLVQWMVIQGLILGLFSSAMGLLAARVLGFLLQHLPIAQIPVEIYNVRHLPLRFEFWEQSGVFAFGVGASVFVALILSLFLSRGRQLSVMAQRR